METKLEIIQHASAELARIRIECERLRAELTEIMNRDRGYVMPSYDLDPSRIIEHQPGCNVLYMGEHAVRARRALEPR